MKTNVCLDCGKDISEKKANAKRCNGCRKEYHNEFVRNINRSRDNTNIIGTRDFGCHAVKDKNGNIDFEREARIVHNERIALLGK